MIRQYGADILRLWVAQTDYTVDQRIGPEILKGTADSYRRLRNTLRFLLGALDGFDRRRARRRRRRCPSSSAGCCTAWPSSTRAVRDGYAAYDFQRVFQALFQFCTVDLSAFYFDVRKDALYCDAATSPRRRAARTVLDALFHRLVTWLAPMLPFTMEEVWLDPLPRRGQLGAPRRLPRDAGDWHDAALAARWEAIRRVRRVVTGALEVERREKRIGASLEAAPVVHVADPTPCAPRSRSVDFADVCITSDLTLGRRRRPRRRLHPRRRPRRRGGRRRWRRARNAPAAGRSCPTSGPTPTPGSAPAATRR